MGSTLPFSLDPLRPILGSVELLGLGEPLHNDQTILRMRNALFEELVASHGFTAIAIESSYPRSLVVNEYVVGTGAPEYAAIQEAGFSHNFGVQAANRELVAWMRASNTGRQRKVRFYGFDGPTEMTSTDSPRQLIMLATQDLDSGEKYRSRAEPLLGEDGPWMNPEASFDPAKSIGLSERAQSLRIVVEDLVTELRVRGPELVAKWSAERHMAAVHQARHARLLLDYHAALATDSPNRIARCLGIRDLMMADNLKHVVALERLRGGRVLAFAHNTHLQRGVARWQLGPHALEWWPAGAHLGKALVNIGTALGVSATNGLGEVPEGTLEHHLTKDGGTRLMATEGLRELRAMAPRVRPAEANPTYFPLTAESLRDFDYVLAIASLD